MNNIKKTVEMTKKYALQMKEDGVDCAAVCETKFHPKKPKSKKTVVGDNLNKLSQAVTGCRKCPLSKTKKNTVYGEGNPRAKLMFIGEGPGFNEDRLGRPFVGMAGKLLDKIIESMKLKREDVYITNIVKCHPMIDPTQPDKRGNDRKPTPEEIAVCIPYLEKQIELIKPKVICALGSVAGTTLLKLDIPIGKLRGKFYLYKNIKLMPTYHPAALLRNPGLKPLVWEDVKMIMKELG